MRTMWHAIHLHAGRAPPAFPPSGSDLRARRITRPALGLERPAGSDGLTTILRPGPARARMAGDEHPATEVWTYNGVEPGPVLRVRQGTPLHLHGIPLPKGMGGVPGLTQKSIAPGDRFDYAFTPPDSGTFWYHSHDGSLVQMGRGLAGALIVEEREPLAVDRELLCTVQDWRLTRDAQIAPGFNNRMEEAMDGRVGNTVTINGLVPDTVRVHAGERVRLRLLNASIARGRILLGPAMRADQMLDMQGEASAKRLLLAGKLQEYVLDGSPLAGAAVGWCLWLGKGSQTIARRLMSGSPWPSVSDRV